MSEETDWALGLAILAVIVGGILTAMMVNTDVKDLNTTMKLGACYSMLLPTLILFIIYFLYKLATKPDLYVCDNCRLIKTVMSENIELTKVKCTKCGEIHDVWNMKRPYESKCRRCGVPLIVK